MTTMNPVEKSSGVCRSPAPPHRRDLNPHTPEIFNLHRGDLRRYGAGIKIQGTSVSTSEGYALEAT